jgi:diguanylate cyclase (GGDEF)-like protein
MCPIKVKGVCKGVMSVNNKENRESFNEKDLCTLCTIAALISETIQKDEEQREVLLLREHLEKERERAKEYIKEVNALKDRVRELQELQKDVKELVHRPKESSIEDYLSRLESVATRLSGFDAISKMQQQLEDLHTTYKEHMDTLSITEEKERLRELHRARAEAEEFALLYKVASSITGLSDPKEIVERALEESKDFFHPCAASYLLLFRGRVSAKLLLHYPLSEEGVEQIKGEMRERSLKILRRKKALPIDLEKDEFAQVLGKEERVQDRLCCPLEREKKSFGFMSVYSVEEEAFSPLHKKVFSIISTLVSLSLERAALFAETKEGAEKDELTGAYNFRLLRKILERELTRAKRYRRPLSLIMLDFDHLKEFNDRFGHHQGNRLIRSVAVAIKRRTRAQDYVARYGGDEFVVVLPETSLEEAETVAERIRSSIHSLRIKRIPCTISASIGVVGAPPLEPKDADNFLKFADKALYQAKSEGRNTVFVQRS